MVGKISPCHALNLILDILLLGDGSSPGLHGLFDIQSYPPAHYSMTRYVAPVHPHTQGLLSPSSPLPHISSNRSSLSAPSCLKGQKLKLLWEQKMTLQGFIEAWVCDRKTGGDRLQNTIIRGVCKGIRA